MTVGPLYLQVLYLRIQPPMDQKYFLKKLKGPVQQYRIIQMKKQVQAQWLTPVILPLGEVKAGRSPELKSLRQAWATWQNTSLPKLQKN